MRRPGRRHGWRRARLALGSLIASLVAAELVYRLVEPAPYEQPRILRDDGSQMPLSEIIAMLRESGAAGNGPSAGPCSRIRGNLHFKLCYDRPRWSYFDADGCVTVETNSLGFRDLEFEVAKQPGELRILAIGDSFTFGSGVTLADSWPQVLERMLRSERSPVEVINAGYATGGHSPPGHVDWLESDGVELDPDIVILGFCLNDM